MKMEVNSNPTVWGEILKVTTTFEDGEFFYNIDGDDYMVIQKVEKFVDNKRISCDISLRQVIPIQNISIEIKL